MDWPRPGPTSGVHRGLAENLKGLLFDYGVSYPRVDGPLDNMNRRFNGESSNDAFGHGLPSLFS
jgi:hypothetical protein